MLLLFDSSLFLLLLFLLHKLLSFLGLPLEPLPSLLLPSLLLLSLLLSSLSSPLFFFNLPFDLSNELLLAHFLELLHLLLTLLNLLKTLLSASFPLFLEDSSLFSPLPRLSDHLIQVCKLSFLLDICSLFCSSTNTTQDTPHTFSAQTIGSGWLNGHCTVFHLLSCVSFPSLSFFLSLYVFMEEFAAWALLATIFFGRFWRHSHVQRAKKEGCQCGSFQEERRR